MSANGPSRIGIWHPEPRWYVGALLVLPLVIILAVLVFYPVVRLAGIAMPEGTGLTSLRDYFSNAARLRALVITFRDSALVAALAIVCGYVLAWTLVTSRSRFLKALVWASVALPFLMGTVVKNYALIILLARRGIVNNLLIKAGIIQEPLHLLYNEFAVVVGILYTMLPYAAIPLYTALLTIDLDMVRAAESLGAGRIRAIWTIVLPLSLPSAGAAAILVFVISLGFYVTPVVLGGATSPFIATLIQNDMVQFFDVKSAAVAALVLIVVSAIAVILALASIGSEGLRKAAGP